MDNEQKGSTRKGKRSKKRDKKQERKKEARKKKEAREKKEDPKKFFEKRGNDDKNKLKPSRNDGGQKSVNSSEHQAQVSVCS